MTKGAELKARALPLCGTVSVRECRIRRVRKQMALRADSVRVDAHFLLSKALLTLAVFYPPGDVMLMSHRPHTALITLFQHS